MNRRSPRAMRLSELPPIRSNASSITQHGSSGRLGLARSAASSGPTLWRRAMESTVSHEPSELSCADRCDVRGRRRGGDDSRRSRGTMRRATPSPSTAPTGGSASRRATSGASSVSTTGAAPCCSTSARTAWCSGSPPRSANAGAAPRSTGPRASSSASATASAEPATMARSASSIAGPRR